MPLDLPIMGKQIVQRLRETHTLCQCEPNCNVCVACDRFFPCPIIQALDGDAA